MPTSDKFLKRPWLAAGWRKTENNPESWLPTPPMLSLVGQLHTVAGAMGFEMCMSLEIKDTATGHSSALQDLWLPPLLLSCSGK